MQSFVELLKRQCEEHANATAIIYHGEVISFGQLEKKAEIVSSFLRERGLKKGDRVALYTQEKLPFLILHLGVILSGGVSVPLNFNFTEDEMVYFLNDSGARFIFVSHREAPLVKKIQKQCLTVEDSIEHGEGVFQAQSAKCKEVKIEPDDYCCILYSSGTTGRPKGVVHTHRNIAASLLALQKCWKFSARDILLNVLPLYHLHGLSFGAHLSFISGSAMIVEDNFLHTLDTIKEATVFMAVPTIYYAFLRRRQEFIEKAKEWGNVRLFTCGSAPIRPEVLPELEGIIHNHIINRYGMTESHVITSLPLQGPFPQGSVGVPLEGVEMRLVSEDGTIVSAGSRGEDGQPLVGEVRIRGENLFSHYWNKEEATKKAFDKDGFFLTGDLGYLDQNGFLTLLGRTDDLIIVDGENVYPPVIERVLNNDDQVRESAVIGVPDARTGERVVAVIVPNGQLDIPALQRHCEKTLVYYQRPMQFEVVEELPRNTMGKVLKRELKARYTV